MTTNHQSLRLDLVIRTSKRKRDAQSPAQQAQASRSLEARTGHTVVMTHDSGRSESGKTLDRDALHLAKQRIAAGLTDGIVVAYLDRLGRAPIEESMTFVRGLIRDGGVLIACDWSDEPIDLADPNVEDMLVFRLQMNRSMWTKSKARVVLNQTDAIKAGKYIGSAVPGFDKRAGKLVPNDDAPFMKRVFLAAGGGSLRPAQALLAERWPAGRWDADRVRKLLGSPAYKGWSQSGELVNRKAHTRIVTEAQWEAAQQAPRERRANGAFPLSGIATCQCGAPLVGGTQTVRGRSYRRMRCSALCKGGVSSITADALEAHVREWLRPLVRGGYFDVHFGDAELTKAQADLDAARAEREEFAIDLEFQRELGPQGRRENARILREAVERAERHHREVSGRAARSNQVVLDEDKLDTHEGLAVAAQLAAAVVPIVVHGGRDPIARRVPLPVLDDGPGMLAA